MIAVERFAARRKSLTIRQAFACSDRTTKNRGSAEKFVDQLAAALTIGRQLVRDEVICFSRQRGEVRSPADCRLCAINAEQITTS
jgi:hypothetical protein